VLTARELSLSIETILYSMDKHILVIDPDMAELRKLREILTREGYNIMTATDKETAVQICQRIPIKFVLAEASLLGFPKEVK